MSKQKKTEKTEKKFKAPRRHNCKTGNGGLGPEGRRGSLVDEREQRIKPHVCLGSMNCS